MNWFLPTSTPTYVLGPEAFFEGSPIGVAIAADDLDIADEAMDLVKVEWEVLPFVVDVTAALAPNAPLAYEQLTNYDPSLLFPPTGRLVMGGNPDSENFSYSKGWTSAKDATNLKIATTFSLPGTDLNAGFAAADQTIDFSIKRTEVWGFGPEVLAVLARWTDNGILEAWQGGEQVPDIAIVAMMLGIEESQMSVHTPYSGGAFGGWDGTFCSPWCQMPIAALLSKKTNLPVKVFFQRKDEHYGEMDEGIYIVKVGFKKDGTITAVQITTNIAQTGDIGFIPDTGGGGHFIEATKVPNMQGICNTAFLNKHAFGAYRCEQQIDAKIKQHTFTRIAAALGVDEGTIATVNNGQEGHDMAWVSQFKKTNKVPDIDSMAVVLKASKELAGWDSKFHAPGAKKLANGKLHGMCLGAHHEFSNGANPVSYYAAFLPGYMTIDVGKVFLVAHRQDCGLDGRTNYSRLIAEEIGMKFEDVLYTREHEGNTSQPQTKFLGGGGSQAFTLTGWVVLATARLLKTKMLAAASATLKIPITDLDIQDSMFVQKSKRSNTYPVAEIAALQGMIAASREADYQALGIPSVSTAPLFISRCVNIVEVEVDPETGGVDVTSAVAVNDIGQPISPETVEGQIYGAAIMGYSTAAMEELVYDAATGIRLNPNMLDYRIMTTLDAPDIKYQMVQSRMGYGPYGSCGVGEPNCTFGSGMIIPAIYNATGVWIDTYPPTPDRVLKALGKG